VKPEQRIEELERQNSALREALEKLSQCPACGGDGVIHIECQFCLSGEPGRCTCANEPAQDCPVCQGSEREIYDKAKCALAPTAGRDYIHKRELRETKKFFHTLLNEGRMTFGVRQLIKVHLTRLEQLTKEK